MTNEQLTTYLSAKFPDAELKQGVQYLEMSVKAGELHAVCRHLKDNAELAFDYLFCLSGVDYPEHFSVVYHLEATLHKHSIVIKVKTDGRQNPALDTVSDIWPTAEFHEREVFDLLGVKFNNHPDLRRLFLDDTWGFPLRKDYVDDVHIVER
jgi:NADH:ubiquinone oxidoreductase subunit C